MPDNIHPIYCVKCKRTLSTGDSYCPGCGQAVQREETASPTAAAAADAEATTPEKPASVAAPDAPPPPLSHPAPRSAAATGWWITAGVVAVASLLLIYIVYSAVTQQKEKESQARAAAALAAAEKARKEREAAVMQSIRQRYPNSSVVRYPGDGGTAEFNANLPTCFVRTVKFYRDTSGFQVQVSIMGNQQSASAPTVYVTLFDEQGRLIGREAIVRFLSHELEYSATREVTDKMSGPAAAAAPYFAAVDGG